MVAGSTPAEGTTYTARYPAIHGFGSFTKSELADGVDESFTVPESLAAGDYYGAVFCINEDDFWGDSPPMGLVPFSVEEEYLAPTGGNTNGVAGIAVLGYSLFALGALGWVLLRRRAKTYSTRIKKSCPLVPSGGRGRIR